MIANQYVRTESPFKKWIAIGLAWVRRLIISGCLRPYAVNLKDYSINREGKTPVTPMMNSAY